LLRFVITGFVGDFLSIGFEALELAVFKDGTIPSLGDNGLTIILNFLKIKET
jgi:hypothetical protein